MPNPPWRLSVTLPVPSEMTATVGQIVTAAEWNSNVRDGVNFLLNKPKARVTISGAFTLGNAAWAQITGGTSTYTVDYDPYSLWSAANNVFFFNNPGVWRFRGRVFFPSNATGIRGVGFAVSSSTVDNNRQITVGAGGGGNIFIECNSEAYIPNASNQYVRLMGYQNSGAAMALGALGEFSVEFLGSS